MCICVHAGVHSDSGTNLPVRSCCRAWVGSESGSPRWERSLGGMLQKRTQSDFPWCGWRDKHLPSSGSESGEMHRREKPQLSYFPDVYALSFFPVALTPFWGTLGTLSHHGQREQHPGPPGGFRRLLCLLLRSFLDYTDPPTSVSSKRQGKTQPAGSVWCIRTCGAISPLHPQPSFSTTAGPISQVMATTVYLCFKNWCNESWAHLQIVSTQQLLWTWQRLKGFAHVWMQSWFNPKLFSNQKRFSQLKNGLLTILLSSTYPNVAIIHVKFENISLMPWWTKSETFSLTPTVWTFWIDGYGPLWLKSSDLKSSLGLGNIFVVEMCATQVCEPEFNPTEPTYKARFNGMQV